MKCPQCGYVEGYKHGEIVRLMIDGVAKEVKFKRPPTGISEPAPWFEMRVYGKDLTGRRCVVESHTIEDVNSFLRHLRKGGTVNGGMYAMTKAQRGRI